jgi:hypothetical protein
LTVALTNKPGFHETFIPFHPDEGRDPSQPCVLAFAGMEPEEVAETEAQHLKRGEL